MAIFFEKEKEKKPVDIFNFSELIQGKLDANVL